MKGHSLLAKLMAQQRTTKYIVTLHAWQVDGKHPKTQRETNVLIM